MSRKDVVSVVSGAGFIGSLASNLIKGARRKGIPDERIHDLVKEGEISGEMIDRLVDFLFGFIGDTEYLKLLPRGGSLILPACDGTRIIPDMTDLFKAGIDPDFRHYRADERGPATVETPICVFEMVKNSFLTQMFGSLLGALPSSNSSADIMKFIERYRQELERICLTQDQIICFTEKYPNWLRADGWATFFPYKAYSNFFVAHVIVRSVGLYAYVRPLEHSLVWLAEYRLRVVVPKLA